jgi:WD40 repeat protein
LSPLAVNPYVGPRPFERGERLYGRDREVAQLRDLLIAERIVLLYSPSGAGKTSLIKASLIPELEEAGFRVLPEIRVAAELPPGAVQPFNRYLMSTLLCLEKGIEPECQPDLDELAGMGLDDYLAQRYGDSDGDVLIFDQFEELLVADLADQDRKSAFITGLGAALRNRRRWALFAMREDLVAGLDPYLQLLPTRLRTTLRLDLLGEAPARMAVQGPARDAGVDFSDAAAARLVDSLRRVRVQRSGQAVESLGPYVEPVQLQVVCERLWERPRADAARITEDDVEEAVDVDSALACYYADKVEAVTEATGADERVIRMWFERALITEQGFRAQALAGPLHGETGDEEILHLLEDAHLIRADLRAGVRWFELAHDRLVAPVRTSNTEWREGNLQPFQRQAQLWHNESRPDHLLLSGDALVEADRWAGQHPDQLEAPERAFVDASRAREERWRTQRRTRRIRLVVVVTAAMLVFALLTSLVAYQRTLSASYAAEAMLLLKEDPAKALERALEATHAVSVPQAQTALSSALADVHVRAILRRDNTQFQRADFSADGRFVVTVGLDGIARTWDAATAEQIASFGKAVKMAQFSPEGTQVLTASLDNSAQVWDVRGNKLVPLIGHTGGVVDAQWSPGSGSRIVTASNDGTATVWDARTGAKLRVFHHGSSVLSARWNFDGSRVVTTSRDHAIRVWDPERDAELKSTTLTNTVFRDVAFSPDGSHVVAGFTVPSDLDQHRLPRTYLWEWETNKRPMEFGGDRPVFGDATHFLTVNSTMVNVWDTRSDADSQEPIKLEGHEGAVTVARFSPDNTRIVSGSEDGTVRIWDSATGASLVQLRGHQGQVKDAEFSPAQPDPLRPIVVTAGDDGTARVWDPLIGRVLSGYPKWLNSMSFSFDGRMMVGAGADGVARVWSSQAGEPAAEFRVSLNSLGSIAFSSDARYVVSGGADGFVSVWERETGRLWTTMPASGEVTAVEFDPSGRLVAIAGPGNAVRIWEWAAGTQPWPLGEHDGVVTDVAFSPDGSQVVSASLDHTARIWDVRTRKALLTWRGHAGSVFSAQFSPDGRFVVTASEDKKAHIWDAATGLAVQPLEGHTTVVLSAAFSHDGAYVVTGALDGTVGIGQASTGRNLALLPMHSGPVSSVQFSPTGPLLLTASQDGTARISDCEICAPLDVVRKLAADRLPHETKSRQ